MARRLAALFIISMLFLLPLPHARYTEWVIAQVADQDYRLVEGALAYVEHEVNSVVGTTLTKPVATNSSGEALIGFTDYEEIDSEASYSYTLYVKYGNQLQSNTLTVQNTTKEKPRKLTFIVNSHYLFAKIHDQKGLPLNATVTVGGQMKRTDSQGNAIFQLPSSNYTARVEYSDSVISREVNLTTSDSRLELAIGLYNLEVDVYDENHNPLQGVNVEVESKSAQTDVEGKAQFYNVTSQSPDIFVQYKDATKHISADLEIAKKLEVSFDLTKPEVKELQATVSPSGAATIGTFVSDPGSSPSGIDTVSITYEVDGVEAPAAVIAVGYNAFEAKVPAQSPGTVVSYTVRVIDKDGNVGFGHGSYSVAPLPVENNQTVEPAPAPAPAGGIPVEIIIVAIVVVAVLGFGVYYYLSKKRRGMPPASGGSVQPPQIPS